eukprot:scaffold32493_cov118-Isochrysis_galbana.AAC.4
MLGLTQRMKCVLVELSVLTSALSDVRKESMTPTNLADLKRRTPWPPARRSCCFSLNIDAMNSSSENCMRTSRS